MAFAALLLMMTAGRVFWISPPTEGSNETHQTSPLITRGLLHQPFAPFLSFFLSLPIRSHRAILCLKTIRGLCGDLPSCIKNCIGHFARDYKPSRMTSRYGIAEWPFAIPIPTKGDPILAFPSNLGDRHSIFTGVVNHL